MTKRRKFSEMFKEMDKINKEKLSPEEIEELEDALKKSGLIDEEEISDEESHTDQSAIGYKKPEEANDNKPNWI